MQKQNDILSSRIRTSDLRMPFSTLQSSALPTELSKETLIKQTQL